jgi:phage pi2 protein 07
MNKKAIAITFTIILSIFIIGYIINSIIKTEQLDNSKKINNYELKIKILEDNILANKLEFNNIKNKYAELKSEYNELKSKYNNIQNTQNSQNIQPKKRMRISNAGNSYDNYVHSFNN